MWSQILHIGWKYLFFVFRVTGVGSRNRFQFSTHWWICQKDHITLANFLEIFWMRWIPKKLTMKIHVFSRKIWELFQLPTRVLRSGSYLSQFLHFSDSSSFHNQLDFLHQKSFIGIELKIVISANSSGHISKTVIECKDGSGTWRQRPKV